MNYLDQLRSKSLEIAVIEVSALKENLKLNEKKYVKESDSDFFRVSFKLLYFLNYSVISLGGKVPKNVSDLEENILVKIEIELQLLSAQMMRLQQSQGNEEDYQFSILSNLVEKIYFNSLTLLSKLELKFIQSKQNDLATSVKSLIAFLLNEIPVKILLERDSNNKISNRIDL